ncbi:MAG: hypothetical protein LBG19_00615 [Prevotellaceae bacterium]|jgi:hypothetical protein|nr:hypothetical protein [Prevotellaceae bacterium]
MGKILQIACCLVVFSAFIACDKDEVDNKIPYVRVDFRFYPYTTDSELASYGGIKMFSRQGYNGNGVFVCQFSMTDEPLFMAFDATCPLEQDTGFKTAVRIDEGSVLKLKCPKCGTVFDLKNEGRGGGTRLTRYGIRPLGYKIYYQVYS